ncbi:uncharacterized protein STAUR_8315 [Stigmatella aurantiaca DW4/3-1]|uniref:Uncharacterized protein n=1 Tax=Stigmatella aurantiaca (strain DW4/3-1) TaxID=378806 RepID=E3FXU0_STIAD|nr:uncharacterized protein STAUR_8315 [Stigmatella aurantiaca DW4/3-1]
MWVAPIMMLWTREPTHFSEAERTALGPTYRRLLLERPGYIARAFERAMGGTRGPFEALQKFAEENRASLWVTEPQKVWVPHSVLRPVKAKAREVFTARLVSIEPEAGPRQTRHSA